MAGKRFAGLWRGRGLLWRIFVTIFMLLVPAPILLLLVFRVLPVPGTPDALAPTRVETRRLETGFGGGLFDDDPDLGFGSTDSGVDDATPALGGTLGSALADLPPLADGLADLDLDADPFASPLDASPLDASPLNAGAQSHGA